MTDLTQSQVTDLLVPYGVDRSGIAFYDFDGYTILRLTDQPYSDHGVVSMIVEDILRPAGLVISSAASNALYDTDDQKGAVVVLHQQVRA